MQKIAGIALVELLLIISVAAIILYLGLERYRAYYRNMQYDLVQEDVVRTTQALNRFYNTLACNAQGVLQSALDVDVLNQLGVIAQRAPYVNQYHAAIVDSGALTRDGKPVYHIEVIADMNPEVAPLMGWLAQRFTATQYDQHALYWVSLPNTTVAEPSSVLWVMKENLEQFKNLKNSKNSGAIPLHAYCFR